MLHSLSKPRYIMIGGFLGAGKTTAVSKLAKKLSSQGLRVGLITNDQGRNLVDTALLRSQGFTTEEIPGGCFCCQFDALLNAAGKLDARGADVLIAEPVGSCTDLVATVTYPLRQLYGGNFTVAPVSVLVDPVRGLRAFGLDDGGTYSDDVIYIYKKQLEEADLIVISKCDLLDAGRLAALRTAIAAHFPQKKILAVSSREGTNLDEWFRMITSETQGSGRAMDVDYGVYARGEALLAWLNCTVQITAGEAFDGNAFLSQLAAEIQKRLRGTKAEVAHLKMTLTPENGKSELGVVNLVRNDFIPELSIRLEKPIQQGQLIINVRAEAAPDVLGTTVREGLAAAAGKFATMHATLDHLEHFRPGKPMPTHRSGELAV